MTRINAAVEAERNRLKGASDAMLDYLERVFMDPPPPIVFAAIANGIEGGRISGQEGAQLASIASQYPDRSLAEWIVLTQALVELAGYDVRRRRRLPIL